MWQTAKVFTKAPGFGKNVEICEPGIITIRPKETLTQALKREGFDLRESRVEIINQ